MKDIGLYIHIPFCSSRCYYCNFFSSTNLNIIDKYVDAVCLEILQNAEILSEYTVSTVYFGGGTPSLIDAKYIERIMETIKLFNCNIKEATIEINPGTVTIEKMSMYKKVGINRVSIGLQSTHDEVLKSIGRSHTYSDFLSALKIVKKAGIENVSIDVMYPLPRLNFVKFKDTIEKIISLKDEYNIKHISVYNLEIHEGSKLDFLLKEKFLELVDEDEEYKMKEYLENILEINGLKRYEISNFANINYESKHNLKYWNQDEYIGIGASASSFFAGTRYTNVSNLDKYINSIFENNSVIVEKEELDKMALMKEYMILKLRLLSGVSIKEFKKRFSVDLMDIFNIEIKKLTAEKLIYLNDSHIILSPRGKEVANVVWQEFV